MGTKVKIDNAMVKRMEKKKMGRPTEAAKTVSVKVRLDEITEQELNYCAEMHNLSKSEVIRNGIHEMYEACKGDKEQ